MSKFRCLFTAGRGLCYNNIRGPKSNMQAIRVKLLTLIACIWVKNTKFNNPRAHILSSNCDQIKRHSGKKTIHCRKPKLTFTWLKNSLQAGELWLYTWSTYRIFPYKQARNSFTLTWEGTGVLERVTWACHKSRLNCICLLFVRCGA